MSSGSLNATIPLRLSRQRVSTTARWASRTASNGTGPWALIWASSWMAEADESLVSKRLAQPGGRAGERVDDLIGRDLVEHRAEVAPVQVSEVFKVHEVRQGWPPDRWGRAG